MSVVNSRSSEGARFIWEIIFKVLSCNRRYESSNAQYKTDPGSTLKLSESKALWPLATASDKFSASIDLPDLGLPAKIAKPVGRMLGTIHFWGGYVASNNDFWLIAFSAGTSSYPNSQQIKPQTRHGNRLGIPIAEIAETANSFDQPLEGQRWRKKHTADEQDTHLDSPLSTR